jgi:hypothetical protein
MKRMRAKVVLFASLLALVILVPAIYIRFKPARPLPAPEQPAEAAAIESAPAPASSHSILKRVTQARPQDDLPPRQFQFATDTDEVKAQLVDLGVSDDPTNLKIILSQLENPNPEIRQAALSATIDFHSKDAIPTLQNEMNWATDLEEKLAIKRAIEFLELPAFGTGGDVTSNDPSNPAAN